MIQLTGVELVHPEAAAPPALADLTFTLGGGEFRWLTGAAGAGKSSLISLLDTTRAPSAGRVVLLGCDPARAGRGALAALRRRIGSVRTACDLLEHLTAFENVALPLRIAGVRPAAARIDATEMLHWVGLGPRMHTLAAHLSRGEALLARLARAVVARPGLLVADEPFAGAGTGEADRIFALLHEVARLGATVVVATRDDRLPALFPAPVLHLERGRLAASDTAAARRTALVPA